MRKFRFAIIAALGLCAAPFSPLKAHMGKVDVGYSRIDVDIINSGEPEKNLDLWGISGNACINVIHCAVVKPTFVWAQGDAEYFSVGSGLGAYLPFWECFALIPNVGSTFSHMSFRIDLPNFGMFNLKQHFHTLSYFVGIDGTWTINPCFTLSATVQYAWADIHTTIITLLKDKGESSGWNYFAQADYYVLPCVSINASVAYLTSRSEDRHGNDSLAFRVGLGYLF